MTTKTTEAPTPEQIAFWRAEDARRHNETEFEVTANIKSLPMGHYRVLSDSVHVFATDIDVLAVWLYEMGGHVTTHDTEHGVTVWTLHTRTDVDPGRVACPVLVSVPLVSGELVMHEITAAVKA